MSRTKTAVASDDAPLCTCGRRITRKVRGRYPNRCPACRQINTFNTTTSTANAIYFENLREKLR